MSPARARYVTVCQQLLALGVVVIALVPATRVVSLDVVGVSPGGEVAQPTISVSPDQPQGQPVDESATTSPGVDMPASARAKQRCAAHRMAGEGVQRSGPGDRECRQPDRGTPPGGG